MADPPTPADNQAPLLASLTGVPAGIHLRFRPKPEGDVVEATIATPAKDFWPRTREWNWRMRNRNRWIEDEELRAEVAELSRKHLKDSGVTEPDLIALARARVVEVLEDKVLWDLRLGFGYAGFLPSVEDWLQQEMRRMPWESVLTMAARKYQNHEKLLVYRRVLPWGDRTRHAVAGEPAALFVESAPGALWRMYDFDLEMKAVETYLSGVKLVRRQNLSLAELEAYVKQHQPAIIHVSAIDGYQGFPILREAAGEGSQQPGDPAKPAERPQEGVYFRDDSGQPKLEPPEAVAAALCAGAEKPLLVTFNLYNSSARLAAGTVRLGAAAAVGFQDFIDDTMADIFFVNLFRTWSQNPGTPLLQAFRVAVEELAPYARRVRGSGVSLWSSQPLLEDPAALCLPSARKIDKPVNTGQGGTPQVDLKFQVRPYPALNYSVLHNGKSKMFETFRIYRFSHDEQTDVRVEVNLNVDGRNFPFRQSYAMQHHILDLTESIAVGLTSALSRSLRESVRTTIFVRITVGANDERYCQTFDVSLLAVDEWIDDGPSGIFLPSFVLPRDPIIEDVMARAQGYLMALADDTAQGFDGYQSCGEPGDDPADALEPQTRAIWYALQHDFAIKYINPPPTFTEQSQRLRTPSEILRSGRGTCIDLALLLAACYEHIGLNPVVFLLTGHAFAGYWADEERRQSFRTTRSDTTTDMSPEEILVLFQTQPEEAAADSLLAPVEWKYEPRRRAEILEAVKNGQLVAIEATYLTNGGSFASACEAGAGNLESQEEFYSMLDISLARDNGVTPLPLAVEEGV